MTTSLVVHRTMHRAMREIPPLAIAIGVDAEIPKAERSLGGICCPSTSAHSAHRDSYITMDFDVLRIDFS